MVRPLPPDRALLEAYLRDGDEDTFRALVTRYLPMVESVSMRIVRDPELAQEVAQNAFTLLARKARTLSNDVIISSWLFKTARYEALRLHRNETTRQRKMADFARVAAADLGIVDAEQHLQAPLDEALARLPERDRQTVLLRYVDGFSLREIASWLGKSEAAAQKQLERVLQKLRKRLLKQGHAATIATISAVLGSQFTPTANALSCAQLVPACLSQAATSSTSASWIQGLSMTTSKVSTSLTIGMLVGLGCLISWQVHDLRATGTEIQALQQARPPAVIAAQAAGLPNQFPALAAAVEPNAADPQTSELPPIILPDSPEAGMRQWVQHKMKEAAWFNQYHNSVLPPDSPEREEYERQRNLWMASASSLMVSQALVMRVFEAEDVEAMTALYTAGYELALEPTALQLDALTQITSEALLAKKESRAIHPQGTAESKDAVGAIEVDFIEGVYETMGDSGKERFLDIFSHQPLSVMNLGFPLVFDSKEQRDASLEKLGLQPNKP